MNDRRKRLLKLLSEIGPQIAEVRSLADDFLNSRLARKAHGAPGPV
jgi:hypothetical protein